MTAISDAVTRAEPVKDGSPLNGAGDLLGLVVPAGGQELVCGDDGSNILEVARSM
ncbi:MAG TPA: hypothetical protein VMF65_11200 [Acidimicrobiales bacterium]|nr:hypothetical protein [Acidimicrobiales bacterium]